ncbi:putative protein TPRXL isoform X2 [Anabas testudineus]|uniref:putative protein TPRXL isoform X2 n=1 Tax=Anabas testudineus TaxID=64144 RepID=UPI000E45748F|nr:putative protein TPRXL isoform X2 [Anabas testudineus]XP_026201836.1 putative protein TPRXL isoform X2 [Anabas testudineus]
MEDSFTWTAVLTADPNRPGSPRLILRKVPAPVPCSSTFPGSTSRFSPDSSSSWSPGSSPAPCSSSSSSSSSCGSSPGSFSDSSSSSSGSAASSSTNLSCSPSRLSPNSLSSSPPRQPCAAPEEDRWTCEVLQDQNKIVLRRLPSARSPEPRERPPEPPVMTAGPKPKWVRNIQAVLRERNRQRGVRGVLTLDDSRTKRSPAGE